MHTGLHRYKISIVHYMQYKFSLREHRGIRSSNQRVLRHWIGELELPPCQTGLANVATHARYEHTPNFGTCPYHAVCRFHSTLDRSSTDLNLDDKLFDPTTNRPTSISKKEEPSMNCRRRRRTRRRPRTHQYPTLIFLGQKEGPDHRFH